MSTFLITVVIGGVILGALVFVARKKLFKLRQTMEQTWTPLQRNLQRRNEVIGKLAEMAEAPLASDPNTVDDVQSLLDTLNGNLTIDQHIEFENRLAYSTLRLLQVGDSSYELRANSNWHDFKEQLAEFDLQCTQSARFYNVSAKDYNAACAAMPLALVAPYLGFGKIAYLATSLTETETPEFGR